MAQVALRQLDVPLFWLEELCQYLLVYLCFLGSAVAWGRNDHLTVEFLPETLTGIARTALLAMVDVIVLLFALWGCYESLQFALFSMRKTSFALPIPVGVGYFGAPIGFALMALQTVVFLYRTLGGLPRVPKEVPTGQEVVS